MDNPWISYIDRSYRQIKAAILAKITNPSTGIPEMVDHSEGNEFVKMVGIWGGIAEMMGYYLDNRAMETFITKLQLFESAVQLARQHDYRTRGAYPSEGYVTFIYGSGSDPVTIPAGTILKTELDIYFMVTQNTTIYAVTPATRVPVQQIVKKILPTVISNGMADQTVILEKGVCDALTEVVVDGEVFTMTETFTFAVGIATPSVGYFDIDNDEPSLPGAKISSVKVNSIELLSGNVNYVTSGAQTAINVAANINAFTSSPDYHAIASGNRVLIFPVVKGSASNGLTLAVTASAAINIENVTNLDGGEDEENFKVYRPFVNKDENMTIEFGNGTNGMIPTGSKDIDITYYLTEGSGGNVPAAAINTIVSTLTLPSGVTLTVTNPENTQGGMDQESLLSLKKNLPLFIRTKDRAVSYQDYIDIARLTPGVYNAAVSFLCGKTVDVYVLPYGGGLSNEAFRERVWDYFEDNRRMITTKINVKPVGEVRLTLAFDIYVRAGYNSATVLQAVRDNLLLFLGWQNAVIKTRLFIGDLYEVVENTPGVNSSYLTSMGILPYAEYQGEGDFQLNWTREILDPGSSNTVFKISFFNLSQYTVHRNGINVGTYSVNQEVTLTEIKFTILSEHYEGGDAWIFRTYPSSENNSGKIELDEFSVITSYNADITLNLLT